MKTTPFASWDELLAHLKTTEVVTYHAPMDVCPRYVRAKAFKNGNVRVHADLAGIHFTADAGHLKRFGRNESGE